MKAGSWLDNPVLRNVGGFAALLGVHAIADYQSFLNREGLARISPYLFLLLMYGWIVFHNRVLFEGLFLNGKKRAYFAWTLLAMVLCSLNMYYIITTDYGVRAAVPHILSFWVYTVTGLGVYVTYRYIRLVQRQKESAQIVSSPTAENEPSHFECMIDGAKRSIPCKEIRFVESLENYIKVHTKSRTFVVRYSLKEAEDKLPGPLFIRISRSHIVNREYISSSDSDVIMIGNEKLRIGKIYKKYVAEQLAETGKPKSAAGDH